MKFKNWLFLILVFCELKLAAQLDLPFVVISLGSCCQPAMLAEHYQVRLFSGPLDWCITPYQALFELISNDFQDYFKQDNLVPAQVDFFPGHLQEALAGLQLTEFSESLHWVVDRHFGMLFIHDFSKNDLKTVQQEYYSLSMKYQRRIRRFYDQIYTGKYIYFIRYHDITKSQAIQLHQLLKFKFPDLKFTLVVIGRDLKEFEQDWQISGIKNFSACFPAVGVGELDHLFYQKLFQDLRAGRLIDA